MLNLSRSEVPRQTDIQKESSYIEYESSGQGLRVKVFDKIGQLNVINSGSNNGKKPKETRISDPFKTPFTFPESNRGSRFLILRMRHRSKKETFLSSFRDPHSKLIHPKTTT